MINNDTIASLATPTTGSSAISVIRISGNDSISIVEDIFISIKPGKKLKNQSTHTIHLGFLVEEKKVGNENFLDQVLISVFKTPFSYTGENMIEISCHGSYYIQQKILQLLIKKGIRLAKPGEFTLRAFLNKKIDLSQAEAIADIISSENKVFHDISLQHIKGSLSNTIKNLRDKLLDFASLLELELDFSEENLIFADRFDISSFFHKSKKILKDLIESFSLGNAIKKGIFVVIVGGPNVGKSTLFNSILKEERSITSSQKGTTRDCIEGTIVLNGILFRFLDTAGIRKKSKNAIEILGMKKTMSKIKESEVILYVFDSSSIQNIKSINKIIDQINSFDKEYPSKNIFVLANKSDIPHHFQYFQHIKSRFSYFFEISAKNNHGVDQVLINLSHLFVEKLKDKNIIVTQNRHYEALNLSLEEMNLAHDAFNKGVSEDLISIHIKEVLRHLGKITGEITNEDILTNIFSKFCIGK
ncbi:tRNA uridine-5-carboxymethylaminomethyl(34) synthesis GTPase MnmE [Blattabacterium cuenoti]|uniref:tRNA uridine-5-carboxymethylaminomethyl(34) synthesis GTPase MnmE n=1 Tax=Blattabacterium cuenoti TaxID=1653831 RepID=UPI00163C72A3|nr:tRNA uridine-5-carboxymethylaminomethyl(34) synthesis GTPase MnmE [Blattabacterium cuenoti]